MDILNVERDNAYRLSVEQIIGDFADSKVKKAPFFHKRFLLIVSWAIF